MSLPVDRLESAYRGIEFLGVMKCVIAVEVLRPCGGIDNHWRQHVEVLWL
jgi:hypothetical protein